MTMVWAYVTSTSDFVEHDKKSRGNFYMKLQYIAPVVTNTSTNSTTTSDSSAIPDFNDPSFQGAVFDLAAENGPDPLFVHGWVLWAAWGLMGFLQIASLRYLKMFPKINLWVHVINGTAMTVLTIIFSLSAFKYYDWEISLGIHSILGFIVLVAVCLVSLGGLMVLLARLKIKSVKIQQMKMMHEYAGYLITIIA